MMTTDQYNLVHITTSGEYKTPLVASQLFDQAECQAVSRQGFAPHKVEAWIIGAMREYVDNASKTKINGLRKRCPHISIRAIHGISRLKQMPIMHLMKWYRKKLGANIPVIYHCRGEDAAQWAVLLKQSFPQDRVILDVRGYWPAETIYNKGIEDPADATGAHLDEYKRAYTKLKNIVSKVDAVTTVSTALKDLLVKEMSAPIDTSVVPCCVTHITDDSRRNEIRKEWGIKDDEIVLVYSGGTAVYQHLEDLTIPFLKKLIEKNNKVRLAFLSAELEKIKTMLHAAGITKEDIILKSFPQTAVGAALTACDVGILIRKPTLVNRVANPVKIAEYLAAGLPLIIEKGVGGVADILFQRSLLKGIEIASPESDLMAAVQDTDRWLEENIKEKRPLVREYAKEVYLWSSAIQVSRKMYKAALDK